MGRDKPSRPGPPFWSHMKYKGACRSPLTGKKAARSVQAGPCWTFQLLKIPFLSAGELSCIGSLPAFLPAGTISEPAQASVLDLDGPASLSLETLQPASPEDFTPGVLALPGWDFPSRIAAHEIYP